MGDAKHIKEDNNWLHPTTTYNRYASLSDDENIDHLQKVATDSTPKPPPIFVNDVITIPPLLQFLDPIIKQLYEIKSESSPKHPIHTEPSPKPLPEKKKNTTLHTYKPKYERTYRVALQNMHFSIYPADILSEIEKQHQAPPPDVLCGPQTRHKQQWHL
jgi:hypothetical protein